MKKSITSHETNKLHVRKGDKVKILSGNYRNKEGEILKVFPKTYRAIVAGLNLVTHHIKPKKNETVGSIKRVESPIHISNLMVIDNAGNATKIGRKKDESGKLLRYSKKTGEFIQNGEIKN